MAYVRVSVLRPLTVFTLCAAAMFAAGRQDRYALVLKERPLAAELMSRKDLQQKATSDRRQNLLARQASIRHTLDQQKISVTGANHFLANVIFVQADKSQVDKLRQLPGVARVERL